MIWYTTSPSETARQVLDCLEWKPPQHKDLFHSVAQVRNTLDKDLKGETSLRSLKKKLSKTLSAEGHSTLNFDFFCLNQSHKVLIFSKTQRHENYALAFDAQPCINKIKLS